MSEFLQAINSEKDLEPYENYISKNVGNTKISKETNIYPPQQLKQGVYMPTYLTGYIGRLIKVESIIGNKLDAKMGILTAVGTGFIVLRDYRTKNTVVCDIYTIKYVTVING